MGMLEEGQKAPTREELEELRIAHENEQAEERALHNAKRSSEGTSNVKQNELADERALHKKNRLLSEASD